MKLTPVEQRMLEGNNGPAVRKAMEILIGLGMIYGAERMLPVTSVQIAGVSYDNLGEAGLQFLSEMAEGNGKVQALTTLNPAGMDVESWKNLGISPEFARNQERILQAYARMGAITTCTCTPYLIGNLPRFGEHIAWAESSAVCYANSVLAARSNREGGPSALASALTGRTPAYGYHLAKNRQPNLVVEIQAPVEGSFAYGALGKAIGQQLQNIGTNVIPYLYGITNALGEELKALCASLATYGGVALFHIKGITPEAAHTTPALEKITITQSDLEDVILSMNTASKEEIDFVSLGCPHLSIREIAQLAHLLSGKKVAKEFWITTARPIKHIADHMGYTQVIEQSGAKIVADTCCVVAPIKGRFHALATDSAKACYYAQAKNRLKTRFKPFEIVVQEALKS